MDPLAHTLCGAALAESGLRRKTACATAALLIGANIPDVDAAAMLVDRDLALWVRRGWTHGILAMIVWPLLLTVVLTGFYYLRRRVALWSATPFVSADTSELHPLWLLGISAIGVWSHPFLDWMNTYGVRLLMPFDGRWFYGDTLFIIDPWIWLLFASGVVLARSSSIPGKASWLLLGLATSALVFSTEMAPFGAKLIWSVWITSLLIVRIARRQLSDFPAVNRLALLAAGLYLVVMISGSRLAESHVVSVLERQGVEVHRSMAQPLPAQLLSRSVMVETDTHYYRFQINWLNRAGLQNSGSPVEKVEPDKVILAALEAHGVRGFRQWARFPHYETRRDGNGWRVWLRDLRYASPDQVESGGIGIVIVELDEDLTPGSICR